MCSKRVSLSRKATFLNAPHNKSEKIKISTFFISLFKARSAVGKTISS